MSLIRCVRREAMAGRLGEQDRKRLEFLYAMNFNDEMARLGATPGAAAFAEREANNAFDRMLKQMAAERARSAQLQTEAENRILADAARHPNKGEADIGEYGLQLINHMYFDAQALTALDLADLSQLAHEFRRTAFRGQRLNPTRAALLRRELHGENTGDVTAKAFADAWRALSRRKIEQYNGAGGVAAMRDDWAEPQRHDSISIDRAKFPAWRKTILATTDMTRMVNMLTGQPFKPLEYDAALEEIFETIVWRGIGGDADVDGAGTAFWRRRNDPRFFVFKNAAAWEQYHKQFGGNQHVFEVMAGYLRSINGDIVAMQRLGPNPARTIEWLAGSHGHEGGLIMKAARDAGAGRPALFPTRNDVGAPFSNIAGRRQYGKDKAMGVQNSWRHFTGEARKPEHDGWTAFEGTINNLVYANKLAFTPLYVTSDLVNQAATRAFNSVSVNGMMRDLVDALRLSTNKQELAELGVEIDAGLSTMTSEARDMAVLHGHPYSRFIVDRAFTFSGLKPMTMGSRAMWTMGALHELTRHQATAYSKLPPAFRDMLERYNIDENAWAYVQATPRSRVGLRVVRPRDIGATSLLTLLPDARPGLTSGLDVALRVMSMIKEEGEFATVSGTPRSARILPFRPGTIVGTLIGSVSKLKSYTISHFQHHGARAAHIFWREGVSVRSTIGAARYYGLSILFPSMVLVGIGTVVADLLHGKEAPDITDWRFWDRVFWRTVSLGFFQDLFQGAFDPESRAQGAAHFLGPTIDVLFSTLGLGGAAIDEAGAALGLHEDRTRLGRQGIKTARQYVPRTWATDLAVDRLFWDNMQRLVDPEADEDFARRAARVEQGMWFPPGGPLQAPDLRTLDLANEDQDPLLPQPQ